MADKTTTLKTKTNDNVYPNVIGDNRKNAFVDSSTITHHFYDKTHKVGFQINNETNIKIQNSLQKPAGLTKTKLVGVGTNGQENIEIGDNLTLANGKLSASGGGGLPVNHAVSASYGDVVYSSLLKSYASGDGNWLLSPLFYKKTPQGYAENNPTFVYAYKYDKDNHNPSMEWLNIQGDVGVASITIKNANRSLKISYLNSAFRTSGYVVPQKGLIEDYSSFTQNLKSNYKLFISVSGFTKSGAPLMLVHKNGKPYVRVVNTTTLEESDVLIPEDATFTASTTELRSK